MDLLTVGSRKGRKRHLIDLDRYKLLSRSKSLCGISGKKLVNYAAAYFNYEYVYPIECKKCKEVAKDADKDV